MGYIQSPVNYTGGKHKLLEQLMPLIPVDAGTFIDLFGGAFNVGINAKADKIIYNDIDANMASLMRWFCDTDVDDILTEIKLDAEWYGLDESINSDGYAALRDAFNDGLNTPDMFMLLVSCSFSNYIRYNNSGKFNMPYGNRSFNANMGQRLSVFVDKLRNIDVEIKNIDFQDFDFDQYDCGAGDVFVYCDPPYLMSTAMYNKDWGVVQETILHNMLVHLDRKGVRWALSNNLKYGNNVLQDWLASKGFNVHYFDADYSNCNYHKIDRSADLEVLITNY